MGVRAEFSSGGTGDLRGALAAKDPGRQVFPGLSFSVFRRVFRGAGRTGRDLSAGRTELSAGSFGISVNLEFFLPEI
jgi:hypothetical protein